MKLKSQKNLLASLFRTLFASTLLLSFSCKVAFAEMRICKVKGEKEPIYYPFASIGWDDQTGAARLETHLAGVVDGRMISKRLSKKGAGFIIKDGKLIMVVEHGRYPLNCGKI